MGTPLLRSDSFALSRPRALTDYPPDTRLRFGY